MPDIALRFHKDMLVLSSPVAVVLARQGFDVEHDLEFANLVEPEAVRDALRLNKMAGAQCLVATRKASRLLVWRIAAWKTARRRSCARACPWRAS